MTQEARENRNTNTYPMLWLAPWGRNGVAVALALALAFSGWKLEVGV